MEKFLFFFSSVAAVSGALLVDGAQDCCWWFDAKEHSQMHCFADAGGCGSGSIQQI
jgi:hypothetical protein